MSFLSFADNLLCGNHTGSQKSVNNFEIVHKIFSVLVLGTFLSIKASAFTTAILKVAVNEVWYTLETFGDTNIERKRCMYDVNLTWFESADWTTSSK